MVRNTPNMPAHKDAPGIRARRRRGGSVAFYWIASDASKSPLVKEYPVRTVRLHFDTDEERSARCWRLTAELKEWLTSRGVGKQAFNGTLTSLIDCYQRDEDSPYRAVKWNTRRHYDEILALIAGAYGARRVDAPHRQGLRPLVSGVQRTGDTGRKRTPPPRLQLHETPADRLQLRRRQRLS